MSSHSAVDSLRYIDRRCGNMLDYVQDQLFWRFPDEAIDLSELLAEVADVNDVGTCRFEIAKSDGRRVHSSQEVDGGAVDVRHTWHPSPGDTEVVTWQSRSPSGAYCVTADPVAQALSVRMTMQLVAE